MPASGFVLAGGRSSRMGQDKALLPYRGTTLLEYISQIVQQAVGNVAVVGDPDRYTSLPFPVYPDIEAGCGPLGGVYTALTLSETEWNVIVACDMPGISADVVLTLIHQCEKTTRDCVVAIGPSGDLEPLCAVYRRRCLPLLARAIAEKRFKMKDIVAELRADTVLVDPLAVANVNTPSDWASEKL